MANPTGADVTILSSCPDCGLAGTMLEVIMHKCSNAPTGSADDRSGERRGLNLGFCQPYPAHEWNKRICGLHSERRVVLSRRARVGTKADRADETATQDAAPKRIFVSKPVARASTREIREHCFDDVEYVRADAPNTEAGADVDAFWLALERSWDIEPREYFEKEAPKNGFGSPLAMAVHYMWKREVKELDASTAPAVSANEKERAAIDISTDGAWLDLINDALRGVYHDDKAGLIRDLNTLIAEFSAPPVAPDWRFFDRWLRATGYTDLANRMRAEFAPAPQEKENTQ